MNATFSPNHATCASANLCNKHPLSAECVDGEWWFAFREFCNCHVSVEGPFPSRREAMRARDRQRQDESDTWADRRTKKTNRWYPIMTDLFATEDAALAALEIAV